jgi:hypothetical protein
MTPLAAYFTGMTVVLLIESLFPSPSRTYSFGAACFGMVFIGLVTVLS